MLDCNHECEKCPSRAEYSGQTNCLIMNKILSVLEWKRKTGEQLYMNAVLEGDRIDKI